MNFDDAERKFADLMNQRDSGQISPADFTTQVNEIRLQDIGGVWWQISEQDGKWLRWNGSAWVPGEPVRIAASTIPVINSAPIPMAPTQYYRPAGDNGNKWKFVILGILGIAAIIAVIVYLNIGGIGNSIGLGGGPESVVLEYINNLDKGDYNRALDLVVTQSLDPLDENLKSTVIQTSATAYGAQGEGIEFKNLKVINKEKITDTKFKIDVTGVMIKTLTSGEQQTVPFDVIFSAVNVEGEWKLVYGEETWKTGYSSGFTTGSNNYAGYTGVYTPVMTQRPISYSTIVTAAPQQTTAMITGTYQGYYQYDGSTAQYPFTITMRQSGSTLTGTIREPRSTFGPNTPYIDSTLQGTVSGNKVYFVKTYTYDSHQVAYSGDYNSGTGQIVGRWNIGGAGGSFTINLKK